MLTVGAIANRLHGEKRHEYQLPHFLLFEVGIIPFACCGVASSVIGVSVLFNWFKLQEGPSIHFAFTTTYYSIVDVANLGLGQVRHTSLLGFRAFNYNFGLTLRVVNVNPFSRRRNWPSDKSEQRCVLTTVTWASFYLIRWLMLD